MITVCWVQSNLAGFIKTIKYIELAAGNMLAITNLAICVNLSFIILVSSGREIVAIFFDAVVDAFIGCSRQRIGVGCRMMPRYSSI